MTIYYVNLTFTVSSDTFSGAVECGKELSKEISEKLGLDNDIAEVFRV